MILLRKVIDGVVWTAIAALVGLVIIAITANSCVPNAPPPDYEKKMLRTKSGPTVEQFAIQQGEDPEKFIDYQ